MVQELRKASFEGLGIFGINIHIEYAPKSILLQDPCIDTFMTPYNPVSQAVQEIPKALQILQGPHKRNAERYRDHNS